MIAHGVSDAEIRRSFRFMIPRHFNIAQACCTRHARAAHALAPALIIEPPEGGDPQQITFKTLEALSNRLANGLRAIGLRKGDRLAILLGQTLETALCHLAAWKLGAITVPLFTAFGPEALAYRLENSGARVLVTDRDGRHSIEAMAQRPGSLQTILTIDEPTGARRSGAPDNLGVLIEGGRDHFDTVATLADDPATIIYTSGTTGPPKGALHAHRVLLGHLPGVQYPQELFPQAGDRFWTPADWAWIGGLFDVLMPSLYFGCPVVASRRTRFDPEAACRLMARHGITNLFMPPTALRLTRAVGLDPAASRALRLRAIGTGGERLGEDLLQWGERAFLCPINEFYGQTEANLVVSQCKALFDRRPGTTGRPVPGHTVAIIDEAGDPVAPGEIGTIAVRRPDPVMFLGYWNNEAATRARFRGDWLVTGDQGIMDDEAFITFIGRDDDIISSSGYRIGPSEIETCLAGHPAVAMSAVIGVPDPIRGQAIKAFIVLKPGFTPTVALAGAIRDHVKKHLAAHEYPRDIAFCARLPLTPTGKVMRSQLRNDGTGQGEGAAQ